MLVLTRKCEESLLINGTIEIKIIEISGDKVKMGIQAPGNVKILRKELYQTIRENQQAASPVVSDSLKDMLHHLKE